jgi:hypothetical protein
VGTLRSVQASTEYKTLQEWPLGSGTHRVCFAKAVHGFGTVGNMRGELHRALRDQKCKGEKGTKFSMV